MSTLWFVLMFVGLMCVGGVFSIRAQGAPPWAQVLLGALALTMVAAGALNYFG